MVDLEPGGLVGDEAVAVGVRLVEGVVGEGLDDVEQLSAQLVAVPLGGAAGFELLALGGNEDAVLLAAGLAEVVGLLQGVAGELLGDPHDRLLVDHEALCVAQDGLQVLVQVADRLAPVLSVRVVVVHVGRHGPGAVEGDEGGDVVEAGRGELRMRARMGRPSNWKTPIDSPRWSMAKTALSSRSTLSMSGRSPVVRSMRSRARSMTERLRRPRKSILSRPSSSTPCISYWVTIGRSRCCPRRRACAGWAGTR